MPSMQRPHTNVSTKHVVFLVYLIFPTHPNILIFYDKRWEVIVYQSTPLPIVTPLTEHILIHNTHQLNQYWSQVHLKHPISRHRVVYISHHLHSKYQTRTLPHILFLSRRFLFSLVPFYQTSKTSTYIIGAYIYISYSNTHIHIIRLHCLYQIVQQLITLPIVVVFHCISTIRQLIHCQLNQKLLLHIDNYTYFLNPPSFDHRLMH